MAGRPTYQRRHFCFRWRGRRWYDPNERKVIWSTLSLALVSLGLRLLSLGFSSGQLVPLKAASAIPRLGIVGTAHDLSAGGLHHVTATQEICVFCHTPHRSLEGIKQTIPVWNHVTTTSHFTMYASARLKGAVDAQPLGPSLACLSCHDGTVAMGALHEVPPDGGQGDYSQATGGVNRVTGLMEGPSATGRDLSSAHPIAVTYRDDLHPTLRPPSELVGVKLYPSNVRGAKVQCASCHDPHNFGLEGSTAPFLRVSKEGSSLCLACHMV